MRADRGGHEAHLAPRDHKRTRPRTRSASPSAGASPSDEDQTRTKTLGVTLRESPRPSERARSLPLSPSLSTHVLYTAQKGPRFTYCTPHSARANIAAALTRLSFNSARRPRNGHAVFCPLFTQHNARNARPAGSSARRAVHFCARCARLVLSSWPWRASGETGKPVLAKRVLERFGACLTGRIFAAKCHEKTQLRAHRGSAVIQRRPG